ncbi:response regulator transcription factor [Elusimicrobiota bacterium]
MTKILILVVEDDVEMLDLLKLELSRQGHDVLTATGGVKALATAESEQPDLILLDVMLPDIDGYHVARQLSERMGNNCPKILIMSSRDTKREKGIALMSGATSIIQKPFHIDELQLIIAETLRKN